MRSAANRNGRREAGSIGCAVLGLALWTSGDTTAAAPDQQQSKPVGQERVVIVSDYEAPPRSLDEAWQQVPLIVRGIIRTSTLVENESMGVRIPTTQHTVEIIEALKGADTAPGATVMVAQAVGETSDGLVKHEGGGRRFSVGEEYVLFLERSVVSGYSIAWGAAGAYQISGDTVTIPIEARRLWNQRNAISAIEMLNPLRQLRARTRK